MYKASTHYYKEFVISDPFNGDAVNADSIPSAAATKNGNNDPAFNLQVTSSEIGRYLISGVIPSSYVKGDVVNVRVTATLNGKVGKSVVDTFMIGTDVIDINMSQSVPTTNNPQSVGDALNAARAQGFGKWVLQGTTLTLYAANGTTIVRTFTLDNADRPTSRS